MIDQVVWCSLSSLLRPLMRRNLLTAEVTKPTRGSQAITLVDRPDSGKARRPRYNARLP